MQKDDFEAWQDNPVTLALKDMLTRICTVQVEQCKQAYWSGTPWPEARHEALKMYEQLIQDVFGSSIDDYNMMKETLDEWNRDQAS